MCENKTVVLGITGGIAAYKMADFSHMLCKEGYDVCVVMTENATKFVTPLTFETLTNNRCVTDCFERSLTFDVEHIALAKRADLFFVAPATANVIAKLANGIADDALTTQALACACPKIIAPAMNTQMLKNPATQRNLKILKDDGWIVIEPASGLLACGDVGEGKLPDIETLFSYVEYELSLEKDMRGVNILVTAGATREELDPVRYITNRSTGKMGYAIARDCMLRGAEVTLVTAPTNLKAVPFVKTIDVTSANEMFDKVAENAKQQDAIIMVAAVADYRPAERAENKIKKSDSKLSLELMNTKDILSYLGSHKPSGQFLCGFSMETENLIGNSQKKLTKKNADMIVANNTTESGAGFGVDTNIATIITNDNITPLPLLSKAELAHRIVDEICRFMQQNH